MKKYIYILMILASLLSFNSYAQTTNGGVRFVGTTVVMQLDDDARNIIRTIENERVAGGGAVFTLAERTYVNYIVTNFKAIGVWSKITALYGFVGGTAASHKWNWKDMRNLDAAYRISFGANTNHSATGALATTNSSNTFLNASTVFTTNLHLSYYSGTNSNPTGNNADMGFYASQTSALYMSIKRLSSTNTGFIAFNESASGALISYSGSSAGYFIGNRVSSSLSYFMRNGSILAQSTVPGGTVPNGNIAILGIAGTGATFSPRQCRFATIGSGLTDTEAIRMSNIVTFAQSILNRQ